MALRWGYSAVLVAAAAAHQYTVEDYNKLPRLYHLDDYDGCLDRGGLYCLGTFKLSSDKNPNFDFIQEYSSEPRNFDRTLLHRGYCVSSRCSADNAETNSTLRFERCMDGIAQKNGFKTTLQTFHYCKTRKDKPPETNISQMVFLGVVGVLLLLNLIGTMYDLFTEGEHKNRLLMAWSARANWRRLVTTYDDGDPRLSSLAPIQGARVLLVGLVIMTHTTQIHPMLYMYKPSNFEEIIFHPLVMLIRNGTALVQCFIVISNFLFAYGLLHYSKTTTLNMKLLPLVLLQRVVRIMPVYLLVVGYAATWWPLAGDGPQWPAVVGRESQVCRNKFWAHVFFLNNFYKADEQCLIQTWFLAVDMQLYVIAAVLMLWLSRRRRLALPVLTLLFVLSTLANMGLAYAFNWKSLLHIIVPENLRTTFRGDPSFSKFYTSPWGSLPACFLGLLAGYLHFEIQEHGYKITKHKWLMCMYYSAIPLFVAWIMSGNLLHENMTAVATALYAGVERPVFALLTAIVLLGFANNVDSWYRRVFAWRGFQTMGRLSLSVLMLHWCMNMIVSATRPTLLSYSVFAVSADSLATSMWSHLLAIPLTVLLELPAQRTFTALVT